MVTHSHVEWTPVTLPSGVPVTLTRHQYTGAEAGPTVYVQAAQHGREICGTETLRRLHDYLTDTDATLAGDVVAVPVADPLTFDHLSYTTPEELDSISPNMNRVWPGDPNGTLHQRLAAALWAQAAEADAVVDLHTATADVLPHVVYTAGDEDSKRLAEAFGTTLHLAEPAGEDAASEWHDRSFDGKLRVAAHDAGIPCITPEIGDSRRIQESAVETAVDGLAEVLRSLGALEGTASVATPRRCQNHLGRVRADASGLFRPAPSRSLGDDVDEGDHLGTLYDPAKYDLLQEVTANHDGVLYALTRTGTVTAGDRLANVAVPLSG